MLRLTRTAAHSFTLARLYVHPRTLYARRWGTIPVDERAVRMANLTGRPLCYLVGIESSYMVAPDLATAVSMHQALTDSRAPIVRVSLDRNVLRNRGRYVEVGQVSTDSTLPGMLPMDQVNSLAPRMRRAGTFRRGQP